MLVRFLTKVGEQARWVLLAGCFIALLFPGLAAVFRPFLPALISLVLGLSIARLEIGSVLLSFVKPRKFLELCGQTFLLMPVAAGVFYYALTVLGVSESFAVSALLFALAPPISSAAGLCFVLGYDAKRALELTLFATLLTPLIGPIMLELIAPNLPSPATTSLMWKLGVMLLGGLMIGVALRRVIGENWINQNKLAFDGASVIGMLLFVIPLFEGVGPLIMVNPVLSLIVFLFAAALNLGTNGLVFLLTRQRIGNAAGGAMGLIWGNRTVALYLATMPFDPVFSLFVAFYQFPMYATPLIFGMWAKSRIN